MTGDIDIIRAIGMMSGTSADGISISYCVIDFRNKKIDVKCFKTYDYPQRIKEKIMNIREKGIREVVNLHYTLGKLWADNLKEFFLLFKINLKELDLISSHGQTIYHSSKEKVTCQIGEVEYISRRFNIPVVYDFRTGDIVYNGEGAPLIPVMDEFLFSNGKPVVLLNIGGISNISIVGKGVRTYGFDTGPGNTLMDWAINIYTGGKKQYDKDGLIALKGKVDFKKIDRFMKCSFFNKRPPKSLDREEFGKNFVIENFDFKREKIEDILATLNYFTAKSIEISIKRFVKEKVERIIISGGGVYNKTLFNNIKDLVYPVKVESIDEYGINPLAKESAGFALLGAMRILNIPSNIPSVTGAKRKISLGKISIP